MTSPSTIDVINAINSGTDPRALLDTPIGGPKAPYRKEKPVKVAPVLSPAQATAREEMRSKLQVGTWIIEFTKVDGTPSIMEATLDPKLLPPADPAAVASRPEQAHLLHVYAVDRQGWRSFVTTNVNKFYKAGEPL